MKDNIKMIARILLWAMAAVGLYVSWWTIVSILRAIIVIIVVLGIIWFVKK